VADVEMNGLPGQRTRAGGSGPPATGRGPAGGLRRRLLLAEAIADLSRRCLGADEPDELLRECLRVAMEAVGADYGTAVRLLPDDRMRVAEELGPDPLPQGTLLPLAARGSYLRKVIESGEPVVSSDLGDDPRLHPPERLLQRGVISGVAVAVRGAGSPLGVLAVHSRHKRRFSPDDVAAVSALAGVVATAWEQAARRELLGRQARHDPLTGLADRTLFLDGLDRALGSRRADAAGHDGPDAAVMLIDLDDFRSVNERFGHAAGDRLLQQVARRLRSTARPRDTVARLAGDEFGVICDPVPDQATAVRLAQRMMAACSQPVDVGGSRLAVSASFGIALLRGPTRTTGGAPEVLTEADAALCRAKELGRERISVFDDRLQRVGRHRRQLEAEMEQALECDEFRLHYQPVRRCEDLDVLGVEALLRWQHPTRGLLGPDEFVPVAEQTGLLVPLGRWVLRTACRRIAQWQRDLRQGERSGDPPWLAVNISPRQLGDLDLPAAVSDAQERAGLEPGTLVLELTESALLPGDAACRAALERLRATGVRLFLDDFGTGYSSLTHLTQLPIQAVKIDRSFVAGLPDDSRNAAVVSALVALTEELDLQLIAEGVETAEQLDAVRMMGCPAVQGYLLDLPASELPATRPGHR
jgi:diguanylate cyclase (GGDEF)-like protein